MRMERLKTGTSNSRVQSCYVWVTNQESQPCTNKDTLGPHLCLPAYQTKRVPNTALNLKIQHQKRCSELANVQN